MKKTVILILAAACVLTLCSCSKESGEDTSSTAAVSASSSEEVSASETPQETSPDTTKAPAEKETEKESATEALKIMSMEVYSESGTFRVVDSEKVAAVYSTLKSLKIEPAGDVKISGGVGVYFQDENSVEVESFYIKDKYIKINGNPEVYEITDSNYDYDALCQQLKGTANESPVEWKD